MSSTGGRLEVVDGSKCSGVARPTAAQPCALKPCGVQWYVTAWSAVSLSQTPLKHQSGSGGVNPTSVRTSPGFSGP